MSNWKDKKIAELRNRMETESYEVDGVLYWNSNDAVIPPFVYKDANLPVPQVQQAAYDKEQDAFFEEYRKRDHTPTPEMLFEMRAAFGEGETVVNVLTGEKILL